MAESLPTSTVPRHRRLPENAQCAPAKADLRKADIDAVREAWREHVGSAIVRARQLAGLSLKEFAAAAGRDERQVARWEAGTERPQFDALFAVGQLRQPLVIALAELAGTGVELETTIRIRRA